MGITIIILLSGVNAMAQILAPIGGALPYPLPPGTTEKIERDWDRAQTLSPTKPDRTFRSVWVRMFPLVSVPLGDPYPDTQDLDSATLSNAGGVRLYGLDDETPLGSGKSVRFDFDSGQVIVDKRTLPLRPLWIVPEAAGPSELRWDVGRKLPNGKNAEVRARLRGGFVVRKSVHQPKDTPVPRELWSVINVVQVDDYLRSVVPSEVISSWHRETLRAQAIAARTYGTFEVAAARASGQDYDVDPSTWYQSYQGVQFFGRDTGKWRDVELASTNEAVRTTSGQVITHEGEVIKAYFSSNSGGRTCTVTECLELPGNPDYIAEVEDHPAIREAPGGTWGARATLTPDAILGVLLAVGIDPGAPVTRLEELEKGPSDRVWRLRVWLADGRALELDRKQTRKIMHLFGPIRSFLYDLGGVASDGRQTINGWGYGHAVGMSQWGAQLYAKDGWSAARILEHYYRNVVVRDLD